MLTLPPLDVALVFSCLLMFFSFFSYLSVVDSVHRSVYISKILKIQCQMDKDIQSASQAENVHEVKVLPVEISKDLRTTTLEDLPMSLTNMVELVVTQVSLFLSTKQLASGRDPPEILASSQVVTFLRRTTNSNSRYECLPGRGSWFALTSAAQ